MSIPRALIVGVLLSLGLALVSSHPSIVQAKGQQDYTCSAGSIPAGTYTSITVNGDCTLDAGAVDVRHDLTLRSGSTLLAAFGGADLTVRGNIVVKSNAALVLGCEPNVFPCFNDPDQAGGTLSSHPVIRGNLVAFDALAVIVHNVEIGHNAIIVGGGGGVNCDPNAALQDGPAYATIEDSTIKDNAIIVGWHSCWLGFIRNTVSGDVHFHLNVTADPDGNEIVTNTLAGKLNCFGNSPAPQVGDSEGDLNVASRGATGQCKALIVP